MEHLFLVPPPSGSPTGQGTTPHTGAAPVVDKAAQIHQDQARHAMENELRTKRSDLIEHKRRIEGAERELRMLGDKIARGHEDLKHLESEIRNFEGMLQKETGTTKQMEGNMREKDKGMLKESQEGMELKKDIEMLKLQIVEKERKLDELKEESRKLLREKEEFHQRFTSESFNIQGTQSQLHEKRQRIMRLQQDIGREESELAHKKTERDRLRHEQINKEQDIHALEGKLGHGG